MEDNSIDCDLLISLVEERPVLWDKTIDSFKDKNLRTEAWRDVCRSIFPAFNELNNTEKTKIGNDVFRKWKNLKDSFVRYSKKCEMMNKSGSGAKKQKEYHLYKQLQFLKKNAANVTDSSIIDDEDEESNDNSNKNQTSRSRYIPSTRKRKSSDEFENEILQAIKENENRHYSFFKAILPSLNKMNEHQTLIFQRVLNILTDIYQPRQYVPNHTSQGDRHESRDQLNYKKRQSSSSSKKPFCRSNRPIDPVEDDIDDVLSNATIEQETELEATTQQETEFDATQSDPDFDLIF